ncbi:MAG: GNAT family N-acetyltransferase [Chloroflexi bacterium]|nr:GNAT family N-acetyltransferase [Chloroflexota bacterium]MCY3937073.1 GNAT family N-acetyltransferase [Chloroflexota bacterium]
MYTELGTATLKSGEIATIARVQGPDAYWGELIEPFLGHKDRATRWQIRETIIEDPGLLESYYYIAHLDDEVISNVATWEYRGSGILGHVYTAPEHRRKGAAKAVMELQMQDFQERDGNALFLGTGYDTVPYHIYKGFGFDSVTLGSGFMHYYASSESVFEQDYFAPGATTVRDIDWHDWVGLMALFACSRGSWLRMFASGNIGRGSFEGEFIAFYREIKEFRISLGRVLQVSGSKSVVGVVRLSPDPRFDDAVHTLDVHVHPVFEGDMAKLIDSVDLPASTKVQAYVGSDDPTKLEALKDAGFAVEAVFRNQLHKGTESIDVTVLARYGD